MAEKKPTNSTNIDKTVAEVVAVNFYRFYFFFVGQLLYGPGLPVHISLKI